MDYKKELQNLWDRDKSYSKLKEITFNNVGIRAIKDISISFSYPITAIAGTNGIGKTTILQTLACLFHNKDSNYKPYRFSISKTQLPYYTFADFFVITQNENKGLGAELNFEYLSNQHHRTRYTIKKRSRWGNYERRPERYVDFIGISRVLPAYEFSYFKNTFSGQYIPSTTTTMSENDRRIVSSITGKNLISIQEQSCAKIQNFKLSKISSNNVEYTSFNMGAGEEVAINLISRITQLPSGSLVLIEEIELGLHPKAQKTLIDSLIKIVKDKKLQLIFTTHSPYIFDVLPPNAKLLLRKISDKLEVIKEPSNSLSFMELTGENQKDLTIYVEDQIAKQLLENLFNAPVLKRIRILDVGSKENVVRMTSAHYHNFDLGKAIGVADGDLTDKELRDWCKKYMLKNDEMCGVEEFSERKTEYFATLPSDVAPEKYILEKIQTNTNFIKYIDDSEEFNNFIINEIDIADDHHALFFKMATFLSKDQEGIKRDILKYIPSHFGSEFQSIKNLVSQKLN
ncbi:MAG: AAA family ATPase [Sulfurimonadaceae bacterium]